MFRSSTIVSELALNLAKVIFMLKHLVKLRRYLLCGCVSACHGMACVLHAVHCAILIVAPCILMHVVFTRQQVHFY